MITQSSPSLTDTLGAELNTRAEALGPIEAMTIAKEHYGLDGKVEWLWGEKDSNYRLTLGDGTGYLLKILNPGEDPQMTAMHSLALRHVADVDPSIPIQRIVSTRNGAADLRYLAADGTERGVRMVTFVPGKGQRGFAHSAAQRVEIGRLLAKMQNALKFFSHPAANHKITWDMKHASDMRGLLPAIDDAKQQARLTAIVDEFDALVMPVIDQLPAQVIHNDFNMENILVDPDHPDVITGIIDFGDMVHAPTVFDVAVAAAYQTDNDDDPIAAICDLLSGYRSLRNLSAAEVDVLLPAILMRMAMRIAIPMSRAILFPDQRERFLINVETVWRQIRRIDQQPRAGAMARLKAVMS